MSFTPKSVVSVMALGMFFSHIHFIVVLTGSSFVEYETAADLKAAVEKLDRREFKGQEVTCTSDVSDPPPPPPYKPRMPYPGGPDDRGRDRYRSRSPGGRRGYPPAPYDDYYERRGPPRGYSPRRGDDYRRRSPPRDFYEGRDRYGRVSPRGRGPPDEYGPPRPRYPEDPYDVRGPTPRRYEDPYTNGHARPYDGRPPSPRGRPRSPGGRPPFEPEYPPRGRY